MPLVAVHGDVIMHCCYSLFVTSSCIVPYIDRCMVSSLYHHSLRKRALRSLLLSHVMWSCQIVYLDQILVFTGLTASTPSPAPVVAPTAPVVAPVVAATPAPVVAPTAAPTPGPVEVDLVPCILASETIVSRRNINVSGDGLVAFFLAVQ